MQTRFKQWMLLALFVPTLAMAQALSNAPAPSAPAAPAAPVDAEKTAAIKALLDTIGADKLVTQLGNEGLQQSRSYVPDALGEALTKSTALTDQQKRDAVPSLQQNSIPKLVANAGQVFQSTQFHKDGMQAVFDAYAKYYSTQEIKDLTAFYRSPTGRKFMQVQDQLGREVFASMMQRYMPQSVAELRSDAEKEVASIKPASAAK